MNEDLYYMSGGILSAAFATDYLGRYVGPNGCVYESAEWYKKNPLCGGYALPCYSDSADVIIRYLEQVRFAVERVRSPYGWIVTVELAEGTYVKAEHPVFARAACIALIKARRASNHALPHP